MFGAVGASLLAAMSSVPVGGGSETCRSAGWTGWQSGDGKTAVSAGAACSWGEEALRAAEEEVVSCTTGGRGELLAKI